MEYKQYDSAKAFSSDVLSSLLKDEAANNLIIGLLTQDKSKFSTEWFMATVMDKGKLITASLWTKAFNLILYENEHRNDDALVLIVKELKHLEFKPGGILAERDLARRFVAAYCPNGKSRHNMSMAAMRLDKLAKYNKAPGFCRMLDENDMFYAPYWERAFSEDCRVRTFSILENEQRIRSRLGKDTHFIWQDGVPVSQAVFGRETPNGAVINGVYTPPHYRGQGYATSVVAEASASVLERGKKFCCLFADSANPISRKIYRKLGYYDVCIHDDIRFDIPQ